jgi:hypothetical protein
VSRDYILQSWFSVVVRVSRRRRRTCVDRVPLLHHVRRDERARFIFIAVHAELIAEDADCGAYMRGGAARSEFV